ncbi:MAG: FAD-dependent monooxygenase [Bryobacteraceae bacterium]
MTRNVGILGGGPAGLSAAIAAQQAGANVSLIERSHLPRHKVCGEFLSPEIAPALERLGVLGEFYKLQPARISRMLVRIGRSEKVSPLQEPAYGLSRFEFDHLLFRKVEAGNGEAPATVIASGRRTGAAEKGERLFGFKAHFAGPCHDAVELYFFDGCYVGINPVERGITNVCGLGPERCLKAHDFEIDSLLDCCQALRRRLEPLNRAMQWLFTGPLEFQNQLRTAGNTYLAGDALSFVDPFTGSGILSAVLTGTLAGMHAANGTPVKAHLQACRATLARPFSVSSALRWIAGTAWAEPLLTLVPGQMLFHFTRPRYTAI